MGKDRKGMKYTILTDFQRADIWRLKQIGKSCIEISELLKINYKTIQSVNKPEKNQEYQLLMRKVEQMAHQNIIGKTNYKDLKVKQLSKIVRKIAKEQCGPQSRFIELIPMNKKDSQKRRIIQQIVANVLKRLFTTSNQDGQDESTPDLFQESFQIQEDIYFSEEGITIEEPQLFHYETMLNSIAEVSSDNYLNSNVEFEQISNEPSSQEQNQNECGDLSNEFSYLGFE